MNDKLAHYLIIMMYSSSQHIPGDEFPGQVPDNRPGFFISDKKPTVDNPKSTENL